MDERCSGDACKGMKIQSAADANKCMISTPEVNEIVGSSECKSQSALKLFLHVDAASFYEADFLYRD